MRLVCEECEQEKRKLNIVWVENRRKLVCGKCLRLLRRAGSGTPGIGKKDKKRAMLTCEECGQEKRTLYVVRVENKQMAVCGNCRRILKRAEKKNER